MKKVIEQPTLLDTKQKKLLSKIDFSDTFATTNHTNTIEELSKLIFNTTPKWVAWLFILRNKVVGLFGLKNEIPSDYHENFEVDGYIGFFKIFSISETEIILGANDKHLDFRAIITKDKALDYNIKVITLVSYNNTFGKIYMTIIKPFHRIVVKNLVKNAYKNSK